MDADSAQESSQKVLAGDIGTIEKDEDQSVPSTGEEPPEVITNPNLPIPIITEVALKTTIASFVTYVLAYAGSNGSISSIPPSLAWLLGLFGPVLATRLSILASTPLSMTFPLISLVIVSLGLTTGMLGAATVNTGLMVGLSFPYALWIGRLRYGPLGGLTKSLVPLFMLLFAVMGLSLVPLIVDGITITISRNYLAGTLLNGGDDLIQEFEEAAKENLVDTLQMIDFDSITLEGIAQAVKTFILDLGNVVNYTVAIVEAVRQVAEALASPTGICFTLPLQDPAFDVDAASSHSLHFLHGRPICVSFDDDRNLEIHIEGGMWILRRMWTESGIDNPLAVFQNFIILFSWITLCALWIAPLLPPVRTNRYWLARMQLPQSLQQAAWYIRKRFRNTQQRTAQEEQVRQQLVAASGQFFGGNPAIKTAFEPRVLDYRGGIPRCTWLELKQVTLAVRNVLLEAMAFDIVDYQHDQEAIESMCKQLEENATALETRMRLPKAAANEDQSEGDEEKEQSKRGLSSHAMNATNEMAGHVDKYLLDLNDEHDPTLTPKDIPKNFVKNSMMYVLPFFLALFAICKNLWSFFLSLVGKQNLNRLQLIATIKFACGFTALVAMSLYWTEYRAFALDVHKQGNGDITFNNGSSKGLFVGWHLSSYGSASDSTAEGTVKKSTFRLLGSAVGAFLGYVAVLATGDNDIGGVAWLTISTFILVHFTLDRDDNAFLGASKDYGYGGFYAILTQNVIVLEHMTGAGTLDALVENRLVANIVGIAMAVLIAIIPPTVRGGDPFWSKRMFDSTKAAFANLLSAMSSGGLEDAKLLQKTYQKEHNGFRSEASALLQNSQTGRIIPFFNPDAALVKCIDELTITASLLVMCVNIAVDCLGEDRDAFAQSKDTIERMLSELQEEEKESTKGENEKIPLGRIQFDGEDATDVLKLLELIQKRIKSHAIILDNIKPSSI